MSENVLRVFRKPVKQGWRWWKKNDGLRQFIETPSTKSYLCRQYVDGHSDMQRVVSTDEVGKFSMDQTLVQVTVESMDIELSYAGLLDKHGESMDMVLPLTVRVCNPRKFLTSVGLGWAKTTDSGDVTYLENLLVARCKQTITDELRTLLYEDLVHRDALPTSWWKKQLSDWFAFDWLELVEVGSVQYTSATADKAKEIADREKMAALDMEKQQQIHTIELQKQQDQQAYEQAIKDIQANHTISEQQREAQLTQAGLECDKAILQSQEGLETVKLAAQKEHAELEAEIDRLNSREDLAAERLKQAEEAEQRTREMLEVIATAKQEVQDSHELLAAAIKEGLPDANRIGQYASDVSSGTMELLGHPSTASYLSRVLKEKSTSCGGVLLKKAELRTRDIGTKRVESLAINTPLQFEFTTEMSGYATILNIGTSGRIWLHSPNAYVGVEQARAGSEDIHRIPGELLPGEDLARHGLEYLEVGPPGWEELVVIISKAPLITDKDLFVATPDNPFVLMTENRLTRLLEQLAEVNEDTWVVGTLAFLVE